MLLVNIISSYIFSILVSIAIFIDLIGKYDKNSLQDKIYIKILIINSILLFVEIFCVYYNGKIGDVARIINITFNIVLCCGTTFITALWILYVDYQIYHSEIKVKKDSIILSLILVFYLFFALSTPITGWFFYIDDANIYHRGRLFAIHASTNFAFSLYSLIIIFINHKRIKKSYFSALILFIVPPVFFSVIQIMFFGLELIWNAITISLLIIYFSIQNQTMSIDYLTGAYNRKKMDNYLQERIHEAENGKEFSLILLDLNNFKKTNDIYGHHFGDTILKKTVRILEETLKHDDFIARYGGDEFVVITNDNSINMLEATVSRLNKAVDEYNIRQETQSQISFCMGFEVYDYEKRMSSTQFLKYVDELMYEKKRMNKGENK